MTSEQDGQVVARGYVNALVIFALFGTIPVVAAGVLMAATHDTSLLEAARQLVPALLVVYMVVPVYVLARSNPAAWREFDAF